MDTKASKYRIDFLKKCPLFAKVKPLTVRKLAELVVERKIHNKEAIFTAGEPSDKLFIIRYGEVMLKYGSGEVFMSPGDALAEISLVTKLPHSSTAEASMDCLIYEINGEKFLRLSESDRQLSQNLITMISSRFRENILTKNEKNHPRRFICHVKFDAIQDFSAEVTRVVKYCEQATGKKSIILNPDSFKGLNQEKILKFLSENRQKYPVIHLKLDRINDFFMFEHIASHADYIIFYENEVNLAWTNKLDFFRKIRTDIRNFEGRGIRYIQEKNTMYPAGESSTEKIFYNRELLSRFIVSRTRGLTLGGGGARALAHVGLLRVLEREKIHFDFVSGSSMGAVVGALYARGDMVSEIEKTVRKFFGSLESPFDPTIPLISFYKGKRMKKMLKEVFRDERIEDYHIPFVTSAIDLQTGEEYVFDKGPLWEALLCAMSLPAVFPPVFLGEHLLVDGGTLNNVPDNLIRNKGADRILSVNVSPLKDRGLYQLLEDRRETGKSLFKSLWEYIKYPPILKIMGRANMLEGREITKARLSRMDCFLHFHLEEFNLFDFRRYDEIINKGESEAEKHLDEIKTLFFPS